MHRPSKPSGISSTVCPDRHARLWQALSFADLVIGALDALARALVLRRKQVEEEAGIPLE